MEPFLKSWGGFLTGIYRVFGPGASQFTFSRFSVGTKKNRDEKLRRFVVVSPREVPSLTVSGPDASICAFSRFRAGSKKMCDEKLCRFVVVSPREVPSLSAVFESPLSFSFSSFRSGSKRTATKSYADSWWYHLGECLI